MIATAHDDPRVNILTEQVAHLFEMLDLSLRRGDLKEPIYKELHQQGLKIKTAAEAFTSGPPQS
jgi:hypothetical protein